VKAKKSQALRLFTAIDQWVAESVISEEEGAKLKGSIEILRFDYKRLAKYSFLFAIGCFVISAGAFILSPLFKVILDLFQALFRFVDPKLAAALVFTALAAVLYGWGLHRREIFPQTVYRNEALFFLGVLLTAGAIGCFCSLFEQKDISPVFLLAAIIYGALGLYFPSSLVWVFALASIGSWFGCETGYVSGWGEYYVGMNYPLRFIPFSICVIALAFYFRSVREPKKYQRFFKPTYITGLLYLFVALWTLSLWGNGTASPSLLWSILFGVVALGNIYCGLKYDDGPARGFGVTFFLINLYTKYFEYFWNVTDKAVFFLLLGVSFWLIGSHAEKLWVFISQKPHLEEKSDALGQSQ